MNEPAKWREQDWRIDTIITTAEVSSKWWEKAAREKADRESRAAVFTPEPEREAVGAAV